MGKSILYTTLLALLYHTTIAKNLPNYRKHDWSNVGQRDEPIQDKKVFITAFGGDARGVVSNNEAFNLAIERLGTEGGTIQFAGGDYLFTETIALPSNVVLKGDANLTKLTFKLGEKQDAIQIRGTSEATDFELSKSALIGTQLLELNHTDGISAGTLLRIGYQNSPLATSDWAANSIAQIVKVTEVDGNKIILESPLRLALNKEEDLAITKIIPVRNAGISCMEIVREDATVKQTSNIKFVNAENCFVKNVVSQYANFAHVDIRESSKISVSGSFFRYAHSYGSGGQGYGVMVHFSSGECLIENNIFEHLRHSIILQAGANGNVISYNYSTQPYWEGTALPSNSAGDIVLHGNYPFANLFEGNVVQNIVIDDSHGKNGYHNTFFRNTAELYGLIINPGPAADSTNLIGNIITSKEFLKGNFFLNGEENFVNGNTVRDQLTPEASSTIEESSLYYSELPVYLKDYVKKKAPFRNHAEERYLSKTFTICLKPLGEKEDGTQKEDDVKSTSIDQSTDAPFVSVYPNPSKGNINISGMDVVNQTVSIYTTNGKQVAYFVQTKNMNVSHLENGLYLVRITNGENEIVTKTLFVENAL